jgi:hypothetical protein
VPARRTNGWGWATVSEIGLDVFAVTVLSTPRKTPAVDVRCPDDAHRLGRVDPHPELGWVLSVPGFKITVRDYEGRTDHYKHPPADDEVGTERTHGYVLADLDNGAMVASRCRHGMHAISPAACLRALDDGERRVLANRSWAKQTGDRPAVT